VELIALQQEQVAEVEVDYQYPQQLDLLEAMVGPLLALGCLVELQRVEL
jgi:hypothetical protein